MRAGNQIVVVAKADGTGAFQISEGIGTVRPCHSTGIGTIMLESMSPLQLERFLDSHELKQYSDNTIIERVTALCLGSV